ncbi:RNA polymerase sigma factor [Stutzerimonas kirkiae]|uniref:RNA polymerase sigma factor n=1 Tax=Stutzerimonas kirkiae TaxID=2211392 RepID=A0A4Q9RB26_9GAMM|nr:RNA polymerase sigma factor [Stutzerimonas kirkiae]TBU97400.1 RNA polymerase sigma factor [Stutzerimonas kirkiae]TBU98236.1 RNA polymerase sigma factor [Stutzerimonas kirkiae]TBV06673.1 RNA polymerase sigma factor [Stutzerimonas kirkiae]
MTSEKEVERIYAEYSGRLRRYLLLKTRQPELAADLTQECFARLLQRDEPLPDNPLSYLFTIANHLLIDHRRNHNQARTEQVGDSALEDIFDESPGPDLRVEAYQRLERLQDALRELPPRSFEVFRLCRLEGLSYSEAAQQLGISVSSVQKHLTMAIAFLVARSGERR